MSLARDPARFSEGGIARRALDGEKPLPTNFYLINATAEPVLASLRFHLKDVNFMVAEDSFNVHGVKFNAGSFIIPRAANPADLELRLEQAARDLGVRVERSTSNPSVVCHKIGVPRIAIVHTWVRPQEEGWFRLGFEEFDVPFSYISTAVLHDTPNLREKYDVIVLPPSAGGTNAILNGLPRQVLPDGSDVGGPIAWKNTPLTPNLAGVDETDDIRGGLGFEGAVNLRNFVESGGLFIAVGSSAKCTVELGLARYVATVDTPSLQARGSIFDATVEDTESPIAYGYNSRLSVYFNQEPVLTVSAPGERRKSDIEPRATGRGSLVDPDIPQARRWSALDAPAALGAEDNEGLLEPELILRLNNMIPPKSVLPRVILRFAQEDKLLISGMLSGGKELAGTPALLDVPVGRGHVILFANNPMWRQETQGSFMLLFNAVLNFDSLDKTKSTADRQNRNFQETGPIG